METRLLVETGTVFEEALDMYDLDDDSVLATEEPGVFDKT